LNKIINSKLFCFSILILLGFLIYSNSFDVPFQFDDREYLERSAPIQSFELMNSIWDKGFMSSRFIALYSFHLNYRFHQLDVFGFHLVNWLIHILASFCVWWLVMLILSSPKLKDEAIVKDKNIVSFLIALLFLSHPVQTQAVTYITQRFASLATLFYLSSACFYIKGRLLEGENRQRIIYWLLCASAAVLGMMTKQIVMTLPLAILLIEFCFFGHASIRRGLKYFVPVLLFLLIIPSFYSFNVLGILLMKAQSSSHAGDLLTGYTYLLTEFRVIITYLRLLLFPIGQNFDYDFVGSQSLWELPTLASLLALMFLFVMAIQIYSRHRLIAFGIFWFFLTLSVESSIIPIQHVIFEHRLYLPSVGFCIVAGAGLHRLFKDRQNWVVSFLIIILTLSFLTFQRNKVWQSRVAFWQDVIKKSPRKSRGYVNLGLSYMENNDNLLAIQHFNAAAALNPRSKGAYNLRGVVYTRFQLHDRAMADFNKALEIDPGLQGAYVNRGNLYNIKEEYDLALHDYNKALQINPRYGEALVNKGHLLARQKSYDQAIAQYDKVLAMYPYYSEASKNRGRVYELLGEDESALADYNKALEEYRDDPDLYISRGDLYARKKAYDLALADYNKALAINPQNSIAFYKRGNIYFHKNQPESALTDYAHATRLDPEYGDPYVNMGVIYSRRAAYTEALSAFGKAIAFNPGYGPTYYRRSSVFHALEQHGAALDDALKAQSLGVNVDQRYFKKLQDFVK